MIISIPKELLKDFRRAWESSMQKNITLDHIDDLTFISDGYYLNERFYQTKDKAKYLPRETVLVISSDTLKPILPGALDLRAELLMLCTSIINDLSSKSYARQLYELYNPKNQPLDLTFPELRFLWNYIRAYTPILVANEFNKNFSINQIKKPFLQGLATMHLAKPQNLAPDEDHFNNYQIWYDSSMFGSRWQDFVDDED